MTDERLIEIKKLRGNIKRQLTNLETLLMSINSETDLELLGLEARAQKHSELWNKFEAIQSEVEKLDTSTDETVHESERTRFEERFYKADGLIKKYLKKLASLSSLETNSRTSLMRSERDLNEEDNPSPNPIANSSQDRSPWELSFQLPKLQTPVFHGSFDTWLQFHDTFKSMCHDNPSIPTIQKFLYLKTCVKDEAAEVIASLEISSENYIVAWELLKSRYDNRKYIVESHIKELLDIPPISKENTIRSLLDNVQKRIRALRALEQPVSQWSTLLIFLIREKLNNYNREKWEESVGSTRIPTLEEFLNFLERRAILESTQTLHKVPQMQKPNLFKPNSNFRNKLNQRQGQACLTITDISKGSSVKLNCSLCLEKHALSTCNKFLNLSPQRRYDVVKKNYLCHNCFYTNHKTIECRRSPCNKCKKPHHILLHFDKPDQQNQYIEKASISPSEEPVESTSCHMSSQVSGPAYVILGTAILEILDSKGQYRACRALLDSCSQCNSITESFVSKLGLGLNKLDVKLNGVANLETKINSCASTTLKSRFSDIKFELSFLVFPEISTRMPLMPLDRKAFQIPEGIVLADPTFDKPSSIDILIGAEYFYELLGQRKIRMKGQTAILQESKLGWLIAGQYNDSRSLKKEFEVSCQKINFKELPLLWELGPENSVKFYSQEEQDCESHYSKNTIRNNLGRYVIKLPFNNRIDLLGDSRNTAVQRFNSLERKFEKQPQLREDYIECMQGYIKEGHMSLISRNDDLDKRGYFLPHHAVLKSDSLTTKTRVVFDGSAKTTSGISLNDTLMVGPTIQEDLFSIVLRFRSFQFVFTADKQQMYRQILVAPEDSHFQKILWRFNPTEKIQTYKLNTVTFGTACAPFLAIRTLHQLAEDEQRAHPRASIILKRDFYVDDLLTGADTIQDALFIRDDLIELLKKGGFVLRKWSSNHPELLNKFSSKVSSTDLCLDPTETVKTLGLHWEPLTDSFKYTVNLTISKSRSSKRSILSETAKLFDPLGLLGPIIVTAKLIIQQLWKSKLSWDDPVPYNVQEKWNEYKSQLLLINNLRFKRCIILPSANELQLHGFCDASERAYGACLYVRSTNHEGETHTALICSKSRVAPLKTTTLPRLELCAATLLIKLLKSILPALPFQFQQMFFWSDSTIVLNWINTAPNSLKTFVANRIAEICAVTRPSQWYHVPTQDNPADALSRGQHVNNFLHNKLWLEGPIWLKQDSVFWPKSDVKLREIPEKRKTQPILTLKICQSTKTVFEKFSKITTLINVNAYCFRFFNNLRIKDRTCRDYGPLKEREQNQAIIAIIKFIQLEAFPLEFNALSRNGRIDPKSKLINLNPFFDEGIIKVGGRLSNLNVNECQKHPIILPKSHHVTTLIIRHEHLKRLHAGVHATLYGVRENYWIIDGRNTVRHVLRKCVTCFRVKPSEINYLMGNLPKNRISFIRPFLNSGIDYCGPFFIKEHRHRNRSQVKTYVAVFVCLATKAVHLEVASDLTTEAFIACLKRFISRRGKISRAPHFGGLWEAAVKSFKYHFTRVSGNSLLTYEQLQTYVVEIEAILNSRPLTPLSSDPNDLRPLTPGHFLIGTSMTSFPQEDLRDIPVNRLTNWQLGQQMRHHFWTRWHKEYVNELITRSKWQKQSSQGHIKPGCMVLIREDNLPPMNWRLGRIVTTHPGEDGIIRTVTIKTVAGTYKRPLRKVVPLPFEGEDYHKDHDQR